MAPCWSRKSGGILKYFDELVRSMEWLGQQPNTIFLGQSLKYPGTGMYKTVGQVPDEKKIEMPVAEYLQLGMSIGLSLEGFVTVSIFPRINFLLCATDQLVNHLDKLKLMSEGEYQPHVIIRTAVGSVNPLNPGFQHQYNYSSGLREMCKNIEIVELNDPQQIFPAYQMAYLREDKKPTILVEIADNYKF